MHAPLQTIDDDADANQYGTFHGGAALPRRKRGPVSVVTVLALSMLVAMLLYVSPLAQPTLRASIRDDITVAHNAQPLPLRDSIAASPDAVHFVRVVYHADTHAVDVAFVSTAAHAQASDATLLHNDNADAWATFNDSLHTIGWSQLWVNTTTLQADELADPVCARRRRNEILFAAGYAEAALTHRRIDEHYTNVYRTFFPTDSAAERAVYNALQHFLTTNLKWMRTQVALYDQDEDVTHAALPDAIYWATVGAVLAQFDGLVAGYTQYSERPSPVTAIDLFMLNADGDLEDLIPVVQQQMPSETALPTIATSFYALVKRLKCSALIRILPDFTDLVWGHATWDTYSSMNRIYKHYDVPLLPIPDSSNSPQATRRKISMSSSPGYLSSVDDWYVTDAGLGIMETTHGVFDSSLYSLVTPESVLSWLRSKVANVLAVDGPSWTATFAKYNSGTYNDQWMVIDTKRFVPGTGFLANGLMVLEQLPGLIHVEDVSHVVNARGYWGSYNVPFFPVVYDRAGFHAAFLAASAAALNKDNTTINNSVAASWSHSMCPRAQIFARDAPQIDSLDDLKRVLRSNRWQTDPLANGHASHAVAARYDLETDPLLVALDGAIDAKVTSWSRMQQGRLECDAASGPTHDDANSVFEWTDANAAQAAHVGQPQRFDFAFESMVHDLN